MQLCFHIRKSPDQRSFASFPELIAGYNVLRRLSMPRQPPYTLSSLTTFIDHRHKPTAWPWAFHRARWDVQTINNVSDRQKGARRFPLQDERTEQKLVGIAVSFRSVKSKQL